MRENIHNQWIFICNAKPHPSVAYVMTLTHTATEPSDPTYEAIQEPRGHAGRRLSNRYT